MHETPEELRWTIFTDTAPEDIYVPLGNKSRWESKQQYFNENDCRVEEHFIRDDQGRIQEIKLWKDTPSYPEETDEPDGWVYSKSYEYQSHYITDPHVFDNLRQQNILTVFPR